MEIVIRKTEEEVDSFVSLIIASSILANPNLVMALATGNTTKNLYEKFIKLAKSTSLYTKDVYGFAVDEYLGIDPFDSISCGFRLNTAFVDSGVLERSHLITPNDFHETEIRTICEAYEQRILDLGGIDLQILGVGINGHLGFNEPLSSLSSRTHVVALTDGTRKILAEKYEKQTVAQIPKEGITLGLGTIMRSKKIILIIKGRKKASMAANIVYGPLSEEVPASVLQIHPNCLLVMDEEAAEVVGRQSQ